MADRGGAHFGTQARGLRVSAVTDWLSSLQLRRDGGHWCPEPADVGGSRLGLEPVPRAGKCRVGAGGVDAFCRRDASAADVRSRRRSTVARPGRLGSDDRDRHELHRTRLALGEPWVESYGSRMRDELLAIEQFDTLLEAQVLIADWRTDYNAYRPHSALRRLTPAEYADQWGGRTDQRRPGHPPATRR
jgi:hypothetical protein